MLKVIKEFKYKHIILLLILSIFTFWRMLKPGMYSTQDFHLFRLYEFDKCVKSLEIPCRWAPDAGLGYGQPIFNYYGQFAYALGEIFNLAGFGTINSMKLLFILSLAGSAIFMFYLAKRVWKNDMVALLSSVLYLFAPYRSVDVWVRGALPESFAFVFYPLIFLTIFNYFETKKNLHLYYFSLTLFLLIITHNLSVILFLPALIMWSLVIALRKGYKKSDILRLCTASLLSLLLSSFYLLPLVFESRFVNLASTTQGYFDFHNHFATLKQLFLSNYWGYGASNWGDGDGLSMAVGYFQWILPLILIPLALFNNKFVKAGKDKYLFFSLVATGIFYLLLTHNKSTFIWEKLPFMAFIQFPWRFLGPAIFCLSLAVGVVGNIFSKKTYLILAIVPVVVAVNFGFFREDIWYKVKDSHYTTGEEWIRQRSASIGDYLPVGAALPLNPPEAFMGNFRYEEMKSNYYLYNIEIQGGDSGSVTLPVTYFPGWTGKINGSAVGVNPDKETGNISLNLPKGLNKVELFFTNTPVRWIGNFMSLFAFVYLGSVLWKEKYGNKNS